MMKKSNVVNRQIFGSISIPIQMLLEYKEDNQNKKQFRQWMVLYDDMNDDMFDGEINIDEKINNRNGIQLKFIFQSIDIDSYEIEELS